MRLKLSGHQVAQAASELSTCVHRAGGALDAVRLGRDTMAFHIRNRLSRKLDYEGRKAYSLRIGDRVVDLHLRPRAGDLFVFHEVFTNKCYRLPARLLAGIRTVIDLGSNVGLTALYWIDQLPDVRLVCVEPSPDNVAVLRDNLAAFSDRSAIVEAAIAATSGTVTFAEHGASWERRIVGETSSGRTVRSCSIDDIISVSGFARVDLLKVDIEGGEVALFDRVHPWMDRVGAMVVELHHPVTVEQFSETVTAAGFRAMVPHADSDHDMLLAVRE